MVLARLRRILSWPMRKLDNVAGGRIPGFLKGGRQGVLGIIGVLVGLWLIWMFLGFVGLG